MPRLIIAILFFVFTSAGLSQARPAETTRYKYYNINGSSPAEIYKAMLRRGPEVGGVNAYASTNAVSRQSGTLAKGKSCTVNAYQLKIDFTINLPKLKNEQALKGAVKSRWLGFSRFLKVHEEKHRSIWLACGNRLEQQIRALKIKTCPALEKKISVLWDQMSAACSRQHEAFDAAEQKRLLRQPFIQLVINRR